MKVFDAHNDCLTELKTYKNISCYLKNIEDSKIIEKVCCVIWTSKLKNPLEYITKIYNLISRNNFSKKIVLCIEDLGFINKNNIEQSIKLLSRIKPFYCGLVWNNDNSLGGGTYGKKGLTFLGKKVIFNLEKNSIYIDTAHMNKKTFSQFSKITSKPIINSHCNFCFCKNHKRNLSYKQIKTVIDSKGQICLSFVNNFISDYLIDFSIIAKQISNFIAKFGYKNLSIGTDIYGTTSLPIDFKDYTNFKFLKTELKKIGISNKIINSIFNKNLFNFYNNKKLINKK